MKFLFLIWVFKPNPAWPDSRSRSGHTSSFGWVVWCLRYYWYSSWSIFVIVWCLCSLRRNKTNESEVRPLLTSILNQIAPIVEWYCRLQIQLRSGKQKCPSDDNWEFRQVIVSTVYATWDHETPILGAYETFYRRVLFWFSLRACDSMKCQNLLVRNVVMRSFIER